MSKLLDCLSDFTHAMPENINYKCVLEEIEHKSVFTEIQKLENAVVSDLSTNPLFPVVIEYLWNEFMKIKYTDFKEGV